MPMYGTWRSYPAETEDKDIPRSRQRTGGGAAPSMKKSKSATQYLPPGLYVSTGHFRAYENLIENDNAGLSVKPGDVVLVLPVLAYYRAMTPARQSLINGSLVWIVNLEEKSYRLTPI